MQLFLIVSAVSFAATADTPKHWVRGIGAGKKFVISTVGIRVGAESNGLIGTCFYTNYREKGQFSRLVIIEGTRMRNGTFWPIVSLQVANDLTGHWRTIGRSSSREKVARLAIQSNGTTEPLYVDLDAFRPMMGKFKYGRVALKSGEEAIFKLEDLLPPKIEDPTDN
jgi:hypothetical protein